MGLFPRQPARRQHRRLLACNVAILALGMGLALAAAIPLYGDALAQRPDHKALAVYLAIMVAGSGFMIVVAVGGLVRNLVLFPLSRRQPA